MTNSLLSGVLLQTCLIFWLTSIGSSGFAAETKGQPGSSAKKPAVADAKGKRVPQNNGIEITPLDPDFPTDSLAQDGYKINDAQNRKSLQTGEILSPQDLDLLLRQSGLLQSLDKVDHFERDILIMRARRYSLGDLSKKYKALSPQGLQRLQELLQAEKNRK